jgi:predicted Rdx family selenoprotein
MKNVSEQIKIKLCYDQNFLKNKTWIMQDTLKCSKYAFTYANVGVKVPKQGYKLHNNQVKCRHTHNVRWYVDGSQ